MSLEAANDSTPIPADGEALRAVVMVTNQRGLHARAAAKFVKLAGQFQAEIIVSRKGQDVSGLSIMGLMMLAAAPGTELEIRTQGPQAKAALDALAGLVLAKFDED